MKGEYEDGFDLNSTWTTGDWDGDGDCRERSEQIVTVEFAVQSREVIHYPNASQTSALGMNNLGWVVGEYVDINQQAHGFVYDGTTYETINFPGAANTTLGDINDAGLMVGSYQDGFGLVHGFTYDGSRFETYDLEGPTIGTGINGVNAQGEFVLMAVGNFRVRCADCVQLTEIVVVCYQDSPRTVGIRKLL